MLLSGKSVCVRACVCPRPHANKSHLCEIKPGSPITAFQFLCKALAIDTIDGQGLSNEARRKLLPMKSKVTLYLMFITW